MEGNGAFQVVVTKMGVLQNPLFLTITPLTFDEFRREGHDLPDEEIFSQLNTIDPAECKLLVKFGNRNYHNYTFFLR